MSHASGSYSLISHHTEYSHFHAYKLYAATEMSATESKCDVAAFDEALSEKLNSTVEGESMILTSTCMLAELSCFLY